MKVYGVYQNTDPVEGKGGMRLVKLFERESNAEAFRRQQSDYPGWPMWQVKEIDVVPAGPDDHTPIYSMGGCSCGWKATAPRNAEPEVWDAAVDHHIAQQLE